MVCMGIQNKCQEGIVILTRNVAEGERPQSKDSNYSVKVLHSKMLPAPFPSAKIQVETDLEPAMHKES